MAELRDLEADWQFLQRYPFTRTETERNLHRIAESALREIERLKRLLVWYDGHGYWCARLGTHEYKSSFISEADAWAAVQEEATDAPKQRDA